mmetsp:Transcript_19309/g.60747  ORF Transcript_19309/g.60747 Transcript_19309/m.60747 type:complete len:147 (-) Transcript_19309:49-489(-)
MTESREEENGAREGEVCDNFVLDVAATTFNICKNCGAAKAKHVNFCRATDELKGKLDKRDAINSTQSSHNVLEAACGNFRRDLSGATFDACVCGFPKSAHVIKALTHGAGNELAMKLTKSGKPLPASAAEDARQREAPCACSCAIS